MIKALNLNFGQKIGATKNYFLCFLLFWILVFIIYIPAWKAGFYSDFLSTLEDFRVQNFWNFINPDPTIIPHISLYQGTRIIFFFLLHFIGINPFLWFIIFTGLHALSGTLTLKFFFRYFSSLGLNNMFLPILTGVSIFLISPVVAEVVVWKAAFHYHTAVIIIFLILNWTLSYIDTLHSRYLWMIGLIYYLSTFMLELFYLTPMFVFVISGTLFLSKSISLTKFKRVILKILVPLVLIWFIYIITFNQLYGKWVAHYEINYIEALMPQNSISNLNKILLHIFFFESFLLPHNLRQQILNIAGSSWAVWLNTIFIITILIIGIIRYRNLSVNWRVLYLLFVMSLLSCLPILALWFNDVDMVANDRYYYLPALLFYILGSISISLFIKNKTVVRVTSIIYISISIYFTTTVVKKFRDATKVFQGIIHNFKWQNADTVFLLNLPNNYDGISIMISNKESYMNTYYRLFTGGSIKAKVYDISSYNIKSRYSGAHVTVLDNMKLKVTPNQYGSWWWYRTTGAFDYENELFKVNFVDEGFSYILELKQPLANAVFLYQIGEEWKEVDRTNIGTEQW